MKLDLDCIRDILLTVEDNTGYQEYLTYNSEQEEFELLKKYDGDKIMYHILQCKKANLLECYEPDLNSNILIEDLTPYGHKFLADIREDKNWKKVKEISKNVGTTSIEAIKDIASNVISAAIISAFNNK